MEIELTISEEVSTIDEFLHSIDRENSKFNVSKQGNELATIHFSAIGYGSVIHLVRGRIDESVLNTRKPIIKLEGTLVYRIGQAVIIGFFLYMLTFLISDFQLVPAVVIVLGCILFLGISRLMYMFAEGIFEGNFYDEINEGKKKSTISTS